MKDLFADDLLGITILRGIARFDFARVEDVDQDENKVKLSPSYRIAIPLSALIPMAEQVNKATDDLKKRLEETAAKQ